MPRPVSATISLDALRNNLAVVRRHAPRSRAFAVIKANAYGHGLERSARAFSGADGFAVLELDAAVRLRELGYRQRILLLEGYFDVRDLRVLIEHKLDAVVHCREQLRMMAGLPASSGLDVAVKINTGMNRLGFAPDEFPAAIAELRTNPVVRQITLMTHFAAADGERGVEWQMAEFRRLTRGIDLPCNLANSAAILRYPETHLDWVRPGIMLYGCSPFPEKTASDLGLKPAMTVASEIIAIQRLEPGDMVGYGAMFTAEREMRIGVIACGYADGYPRHAPNGTPVLVEGRLAPTVGRVSMDMLCVDLSALPGAGVGSRVVLWGDGNPVENVAQAAGTVGYELLCALAPRVRIIESGE